MLQLRFGRFPQRTLSRPAASVTMAPQRRRGIRSWLVATLVGCLVQAPMISSARATDINVAVGSGPVLAVAAIQLAVARGYFKDEGLNVTLQPLASGAATLAALIGGSLQFAPTNVTSVAIAQSKGLKLKVVAQESASPNDPNQAFDGLLIRGDSPIKRARDLAGKTIGVNAINSTATLSTSRAIEKDGGDYRSVKWVELPQGDAMTALATGSVDAVWIQEPFVTIGKQRGFKSLLSPYMATEPNYVDSVIVATQSFLDSNPDTAMRFSRAINRALKLGADHPEAIRAMLPTYMKIAPEVLAQIHLPLLPTQINVPGIQTLIDLAAQYHYIPTPLSAQDLVWKAH